MRPYLYQTHAGVFLIKLNSYQHLHVDDGYKTYDKISDSIQFNVTALKLLMFDNSIRAVTLD